MTEIDHLPLRAGGEIRLAREARTHRVRLIWDRGAVEPRPEFCLLEQDELEELRRMLSQLAVSLEEVVGRGLMHA